MQQVNLEHVKENLGRKFSRDADFLNSIVSDLSLPKNSIILDIGTGWGFMAITLALHGYNVITGEPEGENWSDWRLKAKLVNVEDKITFKPFNAENLPFDNNTFDAVFLYTSLHHIKNKSKAFSEIFRVMKSKGHLIVIGLTKEAVDLIRIRHINHPEAINPEEFIKELNVKFTLRESRYLKAFIVKRRYK